VFSTIVSFTTPSPPCLRTSPSTETSFRSLCHVQQDVLDQCRLLIVHSLPFRQRLCHDWLLSGWTPHWSSYRTLDCDHHWYHFESGLRRRSILIPNWNSWLSFQDRTIEVNRNYAYYNGNTDFCYSTDVQPLLAATVGSVSTIIGGVGPEVCASGNLQVCLALNR
jgi:hypothetical protein